MMCLRSTTNQFPFPYSQASFSADGSTDISIDDPNFWEKWAEKAKLDLDELANKVLICEQFTVFR